MSDKNARHTRLLSYLKDVHGYATILDLAARMDKLSNTVGKNLQYLSENRNYRGKFARELSEFLNVSIDDIKAAIEGGAASDSKSQDGLAGAVEQMFRQYEASTLNNYNQFCALFDCLGAGDEVVNITTNISLEFSDDILQEKMADAILRGARFFYIYPDVGTYKELLYISPLVIDGRARHKSLQDAVWEAIRRARPDFESQLAATDDRISFMDIVMRSHSAQTHRDYTSIFHNYMIVRPNTMKRKASESDLRLDGYALESSLVGSPVYRTAAMSWAWNPLPSFLSRKLLRYTDDVLTEINAGVIKVSKNVQEFVHKNLPVMSTFLLNFGNIED